MTDELEEKFEKWLAQPENRLLCNQSLTSFTAGYELAKEEQDSSLTCDHCCNELGVDDGSVRLCRVCNIGTIYNHTKLEAIDSKRTDAEVNLSRQFKETFEAGYELAKEEQDSNLTCDQCCNELGMDDGSIRLCGECKSKEKHYDTVIYSGEDLPPANTPVLALVISHEEPLLVGYCDEERKWYFHDRCEYFDCDTYVQRWCYLPDFSRDNTYKIWTKVRDKQPELNKEVIMCRNGVISAGAFYAKNEDAGGFVWLFQSGLKTAVDVNDYWQSLPEPPNEEGN